MKYPLLYPICRKHSLALTGERLCICSKDKKHFTILWYKTELERAGLKDRQVYLYKNKLVLVEIEESDRRDCFFTVRVTVI